MYTRQKSIFDRNTVRCCLLMKGAPCPSTVSVVNSSSVCCLSVCCLSVREWYLDGRYLIIIVSVIIIFPLSLMRHLGKFPCLRPSLISLYSLYSYFIFLYYARSDDETCNMSLFQHNMIFCYHLTGYLGYTSGFSLSCMVFFLISVSPLHQPTNPSPIQLNST